MCIKAQNCKTGLLSELMFSKHSLKVFMFNLDSSGKLAFYHSTHSTISGEGELQEVTLGLPSLPQSLYQLRD